MRHILTFAFVSALSLPTLLLCQALVEPQALAQETHAAAPDPAPLSDDPDPPLSFLSCSACHSIQKGTVSFGPNLRGVVGRKAGSLAGYDYSDAMRSADFIWDADKLDAWMRGPKHVLAGTKMPLPGLPISHRRQEIIAYLSALR